MLIVTIAALVLSASLAWFAYRLLQDEHRRSEARVALLTAALDDDGPEERPSRPVHVGFVTRAAVQPPTPTPTPSVPVVIAVEDDTQAVRRFASEADARRAELPPTEPVDLVDVRPPAAPVVVDTPASRAGGLFGEVPDARPADARGVIALGGVVLVGALAVAYLLLGRPTPAGHASTAAGTTTSTASAPVQPGVPLELIALSHERRGDQLVVRGRVRNPVAGSEHSSLVASVLLLDQAGGFLANGRGALEVTRLRPGHESPFALEMPAHKDVRRFRLTLRAADGSLVGHVDRREERAVGSRQ